MTFRALYGKEKGCFMVALNQGVRKKRSGRALIFKGPQDRKWWAQIAAVSSLGIAMVIALVGCVLGGFFLDKALGTRYFFWIGLGLGLASAYWNLWTIYSRYLRDKPDEKADHKSLKRKA